MTKKELLKQLAEKTQMQQTKLDMVLTELELLKKLAEKNQMQLIKQDMVLTELEKKVLTVFAKVDTN